MIVCTCVHPSSKLSILSAHSIHLFLTLAKTAGTVRQFLWLPGWSFHSLLVTNNSEKIWYQCSWDASKPPNPHSLILAQINYFAGKGKTMSSRRRKPPSRRRIPPSERRLLPFRRRTPPSERRLLPGWRRRRIPPSQRRIHPSRRSHGNCPKCSCPTNELMNGGRWKADALINLILL